MLERLVATISTLIHLVPAGSGRLDAATSSGWLWGRQEAGRVGVELRRSLGGVLVWDWDHWDSDNGNWLLRSSSVGRHSSGSWCHGSGLSCGGGVGLDGILSGNNGIWNRWGGAGCRGRGVGHGDGGEGDGDGDRCGAVTSAAGVAAPAVGRTSSWAGGGGWLDVDGAGGCGGGLDGGRWLTRVAVSASLVIATDIGLAAAYNRSGLGTAALGHSLGLEEVRL
jgi:hypothetical protein